MSSHEHATSSYSFSSPLLSLFTPSPSHPSSLPHSPSPSPLPTSLPFPPRSCRHRCPGCRRHEAHPVLQCLSHMYSFQKWSPYRYDCACVYMGTCLMRPLKEWNLYNETNNAVELVYSGHSHLSIKHLVQTVSAHCIANNIHCTTSLSTGNWCPCLCSLFSLHSTHNISLTPCNVRSSSNSIVITFCTNNV